MKDQQIEELAHPLRGPHLELRPENRTEFTPLRLTVLPGNAQVELTQAEAIVGRHSQADIRLAFPEVSRRHCRMSYDNGQWHVVDLDSLNGIWVNGERMHEAVLYSGDRVRVGMCVMVVEQGTPLRVKTLGRHDDSAIEALEDIAATMPK